MPKVPSANDDCQQGSEVAGSIPAAASSFLRQNVALLLLALKFFIIKNNTKTSEGALGLI